MTRSLSSTTGMTGHLSMVVHGWVLPRLTRSPGGQRAGAAGDAQVAVLVVEAGQPHSGRGLGHPGPAHPQRHGHALVAGDVAAAHVNDGQSRLGHRQHGRPQLQRARELGARRQAGQRRAAGRAALGVVPVVVGDVRAAAQHDPGVGRGQLAADDVEERAAARAEDGRRSPPSAKPGSRSPRVRRSMMNKATAASVASRSPRSMPPSNPAAPASSSPSASCTAAATASASSMLRQPVRPPG